MKTVIIIIAIILAGFALWKIKTMQNREKEMIALLKHSLSKGEFEASDLIYRFKYYKEMYNYMGEYYTVALSAQNWYKGIKIGQSNANFVDSLKSAGNNKVLKKIFPEYVIKLEPETPKDSIELLICKQKYLFELVVLYKMLLSDPPTPLKITDYPSLRVFGAKAVYHESDTFSADIMAVKRLGNILADRWVLYKDGKPIVKDESAEAEKHIQYGPLKKGKYLLKCYSISNSRYYELENEHSFEVK